MSIPYNMHPAGQYARKQIFSCSVLLGPIVLRSWRHVDMTVASCCIIGGSLIWVRLGCVGVLNHALKFASYRYDSGILQHYW